MEEQAGYVGMMMGMMAMVRSMWMLMPMLMLMAGDEQYS